MTIESLQDNPAGMTRTRRPTTRSLRERVVGYALGLRFSASVALAYLPWELRDPPDPIVRVAEHALDGGFDPRELVQVSGERGVITLPRDRNGAREASAFSLN